MASDKSPETPGQEALLALFKRDFSLVEANPAIVKGETVGLGITALHRCAEGGTLELMQRLVLEGGLDINEPDDCGDTPLHYAASKNAVAECNWLVEHGADINAANDKGDTPIHQAARTLSITAMTALLEKKADLDAVNNDGQTAIEITEEVGMGSLARSIRARIVAEEAMRDIDMAVSPKRG